MRHSVPVIIFAALAVGCGASARQSAGEALHSSMSVVTDAADPSYALAAKACREAADDIVAREGTTYEEDAEDLQWLRERCLRIADAFETIRELQQAAREAADTFQATGSDDAYQRALRLLARLGAAWDELRAWIPSEWMEDVFPGNGGDS